MIEESTINGRKVVLAYFDKQMQPVSKEEAVMVKRIYLSKSGDYEEVEFIAIPGKAS